MATKFAHRATCHEDSYWQSAEGDARAAEEIVEGTVNTAWMYHRHPALLLLPSQDRLLNVFMHHFNGTPRFYHVAALCDFIAKIGSVLRNMRMRLPQYPPPNLISFNIILDILRN